MHQILKVVLDFGAADRLGLQGSGRIKLITGDDTLYMIVLVAKYYIIVRFFHTTEDSRQSHLDELLLGVRVGASPGLKLEEISVVEVKTLIYIVSQISTSTTYCWRFGRGQSSGGKPKSAGRDQHNRSKASSGHRWLGSSQHQDRSWFLRTGSNRYP
jgi:hypothetical protein